MTFKVYTIFLLLKACCRLQIFRSIHSFGFNTKSSLNQFHSTVILWILKSGCVKSVILSYLWVKKVFFCWVLVAAFLLQGYHSFFFQFVCVLLVASCWTIASSSQGAIPDIQLRFWNTSWIKLQQIWLKLVVNIAKSMNNVSNIVKMNHKSDS